MRSLFLTTLILFGGCSTRSPEYSPESFQNDVFDLVSNKRYDAAIRYIKSADPSRQAKYDGNGYCAIGGNMIFLPGVPNTVSYDKNRDWFIPHTSDAIYHMGWQNAANSFAKKYNQARTVE